ncbi:MAG TPA: YraN family protein [Bacteroidales bacterium]|nr:YraN family protein [Bacteroidales bacterium]
MSDPENLGNKGEDLAVEYLSNNGYRILNRNWKWGRNEIDVIAENNEFIVFAEVKTRTADFMDDPLNAITRSKQNAIIFAAEGYMKRMGKDKECRFDVITIIMKGNDYTIEHIPDAFYPSLK